jgi:hypothetical protein
MHKTFFSWEIFLELLKWSTKPEGGRTPLFGGIEGPANWENWPEPLVN